MKNFYQIKPPTMTNEEWSVLKKPRPSKEQCHKFIKIRSQNIECSMEIETGYTLREWEYIRDKELRTLHNAKNMAFSYGGGISYCSSGNPVEQEKFRAKMRFDASIIYDRQKERLYLT